MKMVLILDWKKISGRPRAMLLDAVMQEEDEQNEINYKVERKSA